MSNKGITFQNTVDFLEGEIFVEEHVEERKKDASQGNVDANYEKVDVEFFVGRDQIQKEEYNLTHHDFISGGFKVEESWTNKISYQAKVIEIGLDYVICECLVDKEGREFEVREFGKVLFKHLEGLKENTPVMLVYKERPGSMRFDVYNGEYLVDMKLFELNDLYAGLENSELTKPIK
ncbi:hypothetical protein [Flagellimonas pelagia]|uniref:Uncharacterized protein n=1 Tax=Flagellimonas pelagia TaxID=2306998 RepID=A0A3A1NE53_9FLAO|nr:hypothetical protein [Allomuricauda maritima]RIV42951.1 hypothetical protein D2V05_15175 [Allomuricauda maritima]TXJ92149.1 hypothetical protein FQ017_15040 [Allomuricauda maritima]